MAAEIYEITIKGNEEALAALQKLHEEGARGVEQITEAHEEGARAVEEHREKVEGLKDQLVEVGEKTGILSSEGVAAFQKMQGAISQINASMGGAGGWVAIIGAVIGVLMLLHEWVEKERQAEEAAARQREEDAKKEEAELQHVVDLMMQKRKGLTDEQTTRADLLEQLKEQNLLEQQANIAELEKQKNAAKAAGDLDEFMRLAKEQHAQEQDLAEKAEELKDQIHENDVAKAKNAAKEARDAENDAAKEALAKHVALKKEEFAGDIAMLQASIAAEQGNIEAQIADMRRIADLQDKIDNEGVVEDQKTIDEKIANRHRLLEETIRATRGAAEEEGAKKDIAAEKAEEAAGLARIAERIRQNDALKAIVAQQEQQEFEDEKKKLGALRALHAADAAAAVQDARLRAAATKSVADQAAFTQLQAQTQNEQDLADLEDKIRELRLMKDQDLAQQLIELDTEATDIKIANRNREAAATVAALQLEAATKLYGEEVNLTFAASEMVVQAVTSGLNQELRLFGTINRDNFRDQMQHAKDLPAILAAEAQQILANLGMQAVGKAIMEIGEGTKETALGIGDVALGGVTSGVHFQAAAQHFAAAAIYGSLGGAGLGGAFAVGMTRGSGGLVGLTPQEKGQTSGSGGAGGSGGTNASSTSGGHSAGMNQHQQTGDQGTTVKVFMPGSLDLSARADQQRGGAVAGQAIADARRNGYVRRALDRIQTTVGR